MKNTEISRSFLTQYFALEGALGASLANRKEIFHRLAAVYLLPDDEVAALFELAEREEIRAICTFDDYAITSKALAYCRKYGEPVSLTDEEKFALDCKGKGLQNTYLLVKECGEDPDEARLRAGLTKYEISSFVGIASTVAFMFFEGIVLPKNRQKGIAYAEKCYHWNNTDGILLLLRYGEKRRKADYLSALFTIAKRTDTEEAYDAIRARYASADVRPSAEADALENFFERNPAERNMFDRNVSAVAASVLLTPECKKRILGTVGKENLGPICEFGLTKKTDDLLGEKHLADFLPKGREREGMQAEICLRKQNEGFVKAPVLVCRDGVALKEYVTATEKAVGDDAFVRYLNARTLAKGSFLSQKNNVVVKTILEKGIAGGVFIIAGVESLCEEDAEGLKRMLTAHSKNNYMLNDTGVNVDLSGCAFLLISETENIGTLRSVCRVVKVENAGEDEKFSYTEQVIDRAKKVYECGNLFFGKEIKEMIAKGCSQDIDVVVQALCCEHSYEREQYAIKVGEVEKASASASQQIAFQIRK